jgi:hypothetical protein
MEIMRSTSVELDPETVLVVTYQYHTEKDPDDPDGHRNLRSASRYRTLGFVLKKDEIEKQIYERNLLENRLAPWKWPQDPSWQGEILYMKDASNAAFSNWLRLRMKKLLKWEDGLNVLRGYKKDTDRGSKTFGKYCVFTPNAVYDLEGYMTSSGETVRLDDREALIRHAGENVWKEIHMKLVGPQNQVQENGQPGQNSGGLEAGN